MKFALVLLSLFPVFSFAEKRPNVLLICVDDLRPELGCYGLDYIHSPNIDRLAEGGVLFEKHYVQAPTCGASRYALLTGRYGPAGNDALMRRASAIGKGEEPSPSLPAWFRSHGYTTVSVGKVSHHPGGRGGADWDDEAIPEMPNSWDRHLLPAGSWQHPRGWMHGLAHGEIRENAGEMALFQAEEGDDSIYPDGVAIPEAVGQLKELAAGEKPFFLAVGILRPHLPFGAPKKYLDLYEGVELPAIANQEKPAGRTTWHGSGEFMKYHRWGKDPRKDAAFALEVRRHYAACVSYADAMVGRVMEALADSPAAENTIVVLWGDHGWHLGEHAIWGKHALFEESLRSPLIIDVPGGKEGEARKTVVESIDLYPTLCALANLKQPDELDGSSLVPLLTGSNKDRGGEAVSYHHKARTLRTERYRLVLHSDGFVELYDYKVDPGETTNIAEENAGLVKELSEKLGA
ncbi:sulfatase [Roseibacillus persicicus]|uniref:sulfatase n=1 Tax=Roseibacillus persicicus TaxID=454148 RepID=UPI00398A6738